MEFEKNEIEMMDYPRLQNTQKNNTSSMKRVTNAMCMYQVSADPQPEIQEV